MKEQTRFAYILAFPAIALMLLLVVYPLFNGVWLSLHEKYFLKTDVEFIGIQNYLDLANDPYFLNSLKITLKWVVLTTLIQFVIGMGVALLLHNATWGKSIFRTLILLPWAIPLIVSAILWRWMYNDLYGVLNYLLAKIGLIEIYQPWLAQTKTAFPAVIIAYCWRSLPFMVLIILAGLQAIPEELYEAAAIDGARADQRFRHVTLPGLRPVISIGLLLAAIWAFQAFGAVWMLSYGGPSGATETLPIHIYLKAFISNDFGYAASMATVLFALILLLSLVYVRTYGKDEI